MRRLGTAPFPIAERTGSDAKPGCSLFLLDPKLEPVP